MKAIQTQAIITSIRSKGDGSLGLNLSTPELKAEEKVEFIKLQNVNLDILLSPLDEMEAPKYKIDKELEAKTPSQRLRGVLYILFEQSGTSGDFEDFYREKMNQIIEKLKEKLE